MTREARDFIFKQMYPKQCRSNKKVWRL